MKRFMKGKLAAFVLGMSLVPAAVLAQDWFEASGVPVQGSLMRSVDLRTEFASIESDIADKLPTLTGNGSRMVAVNSGGTALESVSAASARTNLGLVIGTNVQAWDTDLDAIAALAKTDSNFIVGNGTAWVAETGATARTSLGLGTLATASTINNGDWSGADLAVANGGTGASDASGARTNLGLVIGTDVQALDADLTAIAALSSADSNFIVGSASGWVAESGSTVRSSLGLGSLATASTINNSNWSGTDLALANGGTGASLTDPNDDRIAFWDDTAGAVTWLDVGSGLSITGTTIASTGGHDAVTLSGTPDYITLSGQDIVRGQIDLTTDVTGDLPVAEGGTGSSTASAARTALGVAIGSNVQAWDANLDQVAALAVTDSNFMVGNGTAWVAETGATARTSLGLGSLATLSSINNGNWSGTDLAVANGGTGASDAGTARTNLGAAATSHNHSAADVTSGTLAVARGGTGQTTMDDVSEQVWLQCTIQSDPGGTPSGSAGDCFLYY